MHRCLAKIRDIPPARYVYCERSLNGRELHREYVQVRFLPRQFGGCLAEQHADPLVLWFIVIKYPFENGTCREMGAFLASVFVGGENVILICYNASKRR